ncbi:MAG: hypothetical protein NT027_07420 [Proteobacteria bacterium]|nr:hypothetical protein [Pseudomonadota bacterium]
MKFSLAWANVANQNISLKIALGAVSLTAIALAGGLSVAALKEPLIIDRGCSSKAIAATSQVRTEQEVTAFLKEALSQRFDTSASDVGYLSDQEAHFRQDEQKKLKSSGLTQAISTANLKINQTPNAESKDKISIDTDRVISVGDVRSAFRFPLTLRTIAVNRTAANPYGLILDQVDIAKVDISKK